MRKVGNGYLYGKGTTVARIAYNCIKHEGLLAKEDATNPEFAIDPIMKQKMLAKDFGQYADENGDLKINFLSNNDITGGNSGSPVINADGHLIETAFDGNWEAMSGDIFFEPNIQRTISLDIRNTLWLVDKCYGASNLIDEMSDIKRVNKKSFKHPFVIVERVFF